MAVLQLDPTKAPDLTGTSRILEQAGLSLSRGFDAARGLLGSYQDGQTERADNEVFAEVAKLKTQEQIDAYFDGDGIAGRPISVAARNRLGKMRSNLANLNTVQQQTAASIASQARQELVSGRVTRDDQRSEDRRGFNITNAADQLQASLDARNGVPGQATPSASGQVPGAGTSSAFQQVIPGIFAGESKGDYDALFGFSNRPGGKFENVKVTEMSVNELLEFQKVGGEYSNYVKANTKEGVAASPAGGFQVVGATLKDAAKGLGLTGNEQMTPELQDKIGEWIFNNQGTAAWKGYQPQVTADAQLAASSDGPGLTPAAAPTSSAADRLSRARAESGLFTGAEEIAKSDRLRATGVEGQNLRDVERAETLNQERARVAIEVAQQTDELDPNAVPDALLDIQGQKPSEQLRSLEIGSELASTVLKRIIKPPVILDKGVVDSVQLEVSLARQGFESLRTTQVMKLEKQFRGNPMEGLLAYLQQDTDEERPDTYLWGLLGEDGKDMSYLRDRITEIATATGVTESKAAAAMAVGFRKNPWWFNTVNRRFRSDEAIEFIETYLDADATRRWEGEKTIVETREREYAKATLTLSENMSRREKMNAKNSTKAERDALDAKIAKTEQTLLGGNTPGDGRRMLEKRIGNGPEGSGVADLLKGLDPDSAEFFRIQKSLEEDVRTDPNLSNTERMLLLGEITG